MSKRLSTFLLLTSRERGSWNQTGGKLRLVGQVIIYSTRTGMNCQIVFELQVEVPEILAY